MPKAAVNADTAALTEAEERNSETVRQMVAYLSSHNVAGMLSCFDDDMEWLDVPMEASYRGKAEISAFRPLLSDFLSPQGQLSLDARLLRGGNFEGELDIAGAGTRPFPNVGPIRDIQLSAKLSNLVIRLEKASGMVGGSLV